MLLEYMWIILYQANANITPTLKLTFLGVLLRVDCIRSTRFVELWNFYRVYSMFWSTKRFHTIKVLQVTSR